MTLFGGIGGEEEYARLVADIRDRLARGEFGSRRELELTLLSAASAAFGTTVGNESRVANTLTTLEPELAVAFAPAEPTESLPTTAVAAAAPTIFTDARALRQAQDLADLQRRVRRQEEAEARAREVAALAEQQRLAQEAAAPVAPVAPTPQPDLRVAQNEPTGFDFTAGQLGPFTFDPAARQSLFADEPAFAFETALTEAGLPRRATETLRRRTSDFLGQFQGALGQQIAATGQPNLNPLDFFRDLNLGQAFGRLAPRERGETPSKFNPRTRALFF